MGAAGSGDGGGACRGGQGGQHSVGIGRQVGEAVIRTLDGRALRRAREGEGELLADQIAQFQLRPFGARALHGRRRSAGQLGAGLAIGAEMTSFTHLHVASAFSGHYGVTRPEVMAEAAAASGFNALAIISAVCLVLNKSEAKIKSKDLFCSAKIFVGYFRNLITSYITYECPAS